MSVKRTVASTRLGSTSGLEAGQELFDLIGHSVCITRPENVVFSREFDILRIRNVLRQVAASLDAHSGITGPVHDERGHSNGWQDRANIDLAVHAREMDSCCGAAPQSLKARPPGLELRVGGATSCKNADHLACAPQGIHLRQGGLQLVSGDDPRPVVSIGSIEHEGVGSLGVGRREQHGHRATF